MPINETTPIGYTVYISIELFSIVITGHTAICALLLLVGFFGIMVSFAQSVQKKLYDLNKNYTIDRNDVKLKDELRDVVQFYIEIKG